MTAGEKMARMEKILQGKDPGPTKFQEWWHDRAEEHVKRLVLGLTGFFLLACGFGIIVGVIYFFETHQSLIWWVAAPAAALGFAYGLGAIIREIR